jgi:hypothetical protein
VWTQLDDWGFKRITAHLSKRIVLEVTTMTVRIAEMLSDLVESIELIWRDIIAKPISPIISKS